MECIEHMGDVRMNRKDKRYLTERAELIEQLAWNIEHGVNETVKGLTVNESMRHMAGEMRSYARSA